MFVWARKHFLFPTLVFVMLHAALACTPQATTDEDAPSARSSTMINNPVVTPTVIIVPSLTPTGDGDSDENDEESVIIEPNHNIVENENSASLTANEVEHFEAQVAAPKKVQ